MLSGVGQRHRTLYTVYNMYRHSVACKIQIKRIDFSVCTIVVRNFCKVITQKYKLYDMTDFVNTDFLAKYAVFLCVFLYYLTLALPLCYF